jgi:thioesterase domain-containing protein
VLRGPLRTFSSCLRATYTPGGVYPDPLRIVMVNEIGYDEEANQRQFLETARGWQRWAPALSSCVGPGNHMTVLKEPHVRDLAALLAAV